MPVFYCVLIYGVEMLFVIMGTGCKTVTRIHTDETDASGKPINNKNNQF
jgi:hypothetical protein